MPQLEPRPFRKPSRAVLCECPECRGELAVLSVISGRAGAEYWALQCMACGGLHLDIIEPAPLLH